MITIDKKGIKHITGKGFRLVHDDTKVITLIEGTEQTITSANYRVEEWGIKQEALNRIDVLGLEYHQNEIIIKDKEL